MAQGKSDKYSNTAANVARNKQRKAEKREKELVKGKEKKARRLADGTFMKATKEKRKFAKPKVKDKKR